MSDTAVPSALKRWFVLHFAADWLFAIPLFVAPRAFLGALGWREIDPISSRLVAAALIGIGTQSLLSRNNSVESYRALLELKILWSASATLGLVWSALDGGPAMTWAFVCVFAGFNALWSYWRWRLRRS
ncbi:MAG: hypothetical protein Q8Q09_19020 [Deltaproteobacteria bacterium]|nr:hypothetical protein [Deltaproteobacteria bacterium]